MQMELTKKRRKAVLIDAENREISVVGIDAKHQLDDMCAKICCNTVDCVRSYLNFYWGCDDDIWIDDEGSFRMKQDEDKNDVQYGFMVPQDRTGTAFLLLWNGLIMGFDPNTGDSMDTSLTDIQIEVLRHTIIFVKLRNGRVLNAWLNGEDVTNMVSQGMAHA